MDRLIPKSQIGLWVIPDLGIEGTTIIGDDTAFNKSLTVYGGEGEIAFLNATKDVVTAYDPLPDKGWIEAGKIYSYQSRFVICRQSHERTIYPPEQTPALFAVYRADAGDVLDWIPDEKVDRDFVRLYKDKKYICLQAHQTQIDWTPDKTPALWKEVIPPVTTPVWIEWYAYKVGDIVLYQPNNTLYRCLQAHTSQPTWTPPAVPALWSKM